MPTELRWLVSTSASCLHAAEALARGIAPADRATADALAAEARGLIDAVDSLGMDREQFFQHAAALAARSDVPIEWARTLHAKLIGPDQSADAAYDLANHYRALRDAFAAAQPAALDELELRSEPLRQQWEARGPGLMAIVGRTTEPELVVEQADAILVHPLVGGAGAAHWMYNSVRIEAVLANPIAELPEVARLAWLVAQLNLDLPRYQLGLYRQRLIEVWRLAMIAPVLSAAQEVELTRADEPTVTMAIKAWYGPTRANAAELLSRWWETYRETSPTWPVALGALDQMLAGA